MYVRKLIKVYDEHYSFLNRIRKSIKDSKIILIPYFMIVLSPIGFYIILISNIHLRNWLMVGILLFYLGGIFWCSSINGRNIKSIYGDYQKYEEHKLSKIDTVIKEVFKINSVEHYKLLDSLVMKEIEEIDEIKTFPFSNTIKQLVIAVLITGLLSYSFKELMNGNSELGFPLLTLYLMILGTIVMLSSLIYILRENTKKYKLKQISKLITELQLRLSIINSNEINKN